MKKFIAIIFLFISVTGYGKVKYFFNPKETFSGDALQFVKLVRAGDAARAETFIKNTKGFDINKPVELPAKFNFKKLEKLSSFESLMNKIILLFPKEGGSGQTVTFLTYFVVNNDIEAVRTLLRLGADPEIAGTWYEHAFLAACKFNRHEILDVLFESRPFFRLAIENQVKVLERLPYVTIVKHWGSPTEYELDPSMLKVGLKHRVNYNMEFPLGETFLTSNMSEAGYKTVIWLLRNNAVKADLPDRHGDTVASIAYEWLKDIKDVEKEKFRKEHLLKIKEELEKKGIKVQPKKNSF